MEVVIVEDQATGGAIVGEAVGSLIDRRPDAVLGLATGGSPRPVYDDLAARYVAGTVSLADARACRLDEYVGLPADHPASYHNVIEREVRSRVGLRPGNVFGPDGTADDVAAACAAYEDLIGSLGGVDLQLLGIGTTGHIGFNEPTSSLASRTRVKTLTAQTRADNARFFGGDLESVPHHVLTQGVGTILQARHLVLLAWGEHKARAVAQCVEGPVTAMVPASALQLHPHVSIVVDQQAASQLALVDYYRAVWEAKPAWQSL